MQGACFVPKFGRYPRHASYRIRADFGNKRWCPADLAPITLLKHLTNRLLLLHMYGLAGVASAYNHLQIALSLHAPLKTPLHDIVCYGLFVTAILCRGDDTVMTALQHGAEAEVADRLRFCNTHS